MQICGRGVEQRFELLAKVKGPVSQVETRVDVGDDRLEGGTDGVLQVGGAIEIDLLAAVEQRAAQEGPLQVPDQGDLQLVALLALLGERILGVGGAVFSKAFVARDLHKRLVALESPFKAFGRVGHPPGDLCPWRRRPDSAARSPRSPASTGCQGERKRTSSSGPVSTASPSRRTP